MLNRNGNFNQPGRTYVFVVTQHACYRSTGPGSWICSGCSENDDDNVVTSPISAASASISAAWPDPYPANNPPMQE
ncbi:MAG: hypothetical protein IPP40_16045 [bacterium]|nr:hypothetical protein [bacterium]